MAASLVSGPMSKLKAIHIDLSLAVTALLVGWCMLQWLQIDACRDQQRLGTQHEREELLHPVDAGVAAAFLR